MTCAMSTGDCFRDAKVYCLDFHSMKIMGEMLRDTGAFFMRRSFDNDPVYWETFRQYVSQLITSGNLPVEFFIEGTRSRTGKSLWPKVGLFSMLLKPYFTSEVTDILVVPINISYDRILEEKLFAYELLGVPKPKESTSGFFKALSILNEHYGDVFIDIAEPISVKQYLGDEVRKHHTCGPVYDQSLSTGEKSVIHSLALDVVRTQQNHATISTFNLMAVVLMNEYIMGKKMMPYALLKREISWLNAVLECLGARTNADNLDVSMPASLEIHHTLVYMNENREIQLIESPGSSTGQLPIDTTQLKAHRLDQSTMDKAVPAVKLQLYVNPVLHYLVNPALVTLVMRSIRGANEDAQISKEELFQHYSFLRMVLMQEFVLPETRCQQDFEASLEHLDSLNIVVQTDSGKYMLGNHLKLQAILCNMLLPFLYTVKSVCHSVAKISASDFIQEKTILVETQKYVEECLKKQFSYPYMLCLDAICNSLQSLAGFGVLEKIRRNGAWLFKVNADRALSVIHKIDKLTLENVPATNLQQSAVPIQVTSKL